MTIACWVCPVAWNLCLAYDTTTLNTDPPGTPKAMIVMMMMMIDDDDDHADDDEDGDHDPLATLVWSRARESRLKVIQTHVQAYF